MVLGTVAKRNLVVDDRIVRRIRRIEDANGASGMILVADLAADGIGDERVPPVDDLLKEGRRNGVDVVRTEDAGGLQVDGVRATRLLVVVGRTRIVEIAPELRRVDAHILHLRERHLVRVDVVHREEAGDALAACRRRDEPRHPVVAVNEVWLHRVDDVVDHLTLERERQLRVAIALGIDMVTIIEAAVLGQVDALVRHAALVHAKLVRDKLRRLFVEHPAVVRQRHMHVRAEVKERRDERGGDVGHATCLRAHLSRKVAHPLRQIGDLRRDDQDARLFRPGCRFSSGLTCAHLFFSILPININGPHQRAQRTTAIHQDRGSVCAGTLSRARISPRPPPWHRARGLRPPARRRPLD